MAQGYFRVNGHATFTDCDNDKIHDSCPGLGGAIYNGPEGSILFKGGVTVQDMSINVSVVNSHAQYIYLLVCCLYCLKTYEELLVTSNMNSSVRDDKMTYGQTRITFLGFVYWFVSSVVMKWQDICDDNAAIYNAGKINIKGDSMFLDISANNFDWKHVSRGLNSACVR